MKPCWDFQVCLGASSGSGWAEVHVLSCSHVVLFRASEAEIASVMGQRARIWEGTELGQVPKWTAPYGVTVSNQSWREG